MIRIGNNVWRTLQHPIYADGKKVLEVWADGQMVYPESQANFIKIRGKISYNVPYHQDAQTISYVDYGSWPALDGVFSGSAAFAACIACRDSYGNIGADYFFTLTGIKPTETVDGIYSSLLNPGWTDRQGLSTNVLSFGGQAKSLGIKPNRTLNNYHRRSVDKLIYRQDMHPLRVVDERSDIVNSYGYSDAGYSYNTRLLNPYYTEIAAMNGTIISEDSELGNNNAYIKLDREDILLGLCLGEMNWNPRGNYLSVHIKSKVRSQGIHMYNIRKTLTGESEPDIYADVRMGEVYYNVPITDIMYFGDYYTAPDEMRTVTEDDLNF